MPSLEIWEEGKMFKKCLAVIVILLFIGVAFAIPINANVSKSSLETDSIIEVFEENVIVKPSDEDCGCEDEITPDWDYPIICWILERLWFIIPQFSPFPVPLMHWIIIFINEIFDCPNIP